MRLSHVRSASLLAGRSLLIASIATALLAVSMPAWAQRPKKKASKAPQPQTVAMRLWVPAYYYPFGPGLREWNRLIASAESVPIVAIVNPASGPGDHVDTNFAAILPRAGKPGSPSSATSGPNTRASQWRR